MIPETQTELTAREFFNGKYALSADPWKFASSPYELSRYATILRALGGRRFHRAFEPGCSIGVLTEVLAAHCDHVEAMDISWLAIDRARERCRHLPNVSFSCGELPASVPEGAFDLLVLSEIAYYFDAPALRLLANLLVARVRPGGTVLAVNWLGASPEHRLSGDRVHEILRETEGLSPAHNERHEAFRLDMWTRA